MWWRSIAVIMFVVLGGVGVLTAPVGGGLFAAAQQPPVGATPTANAAGRVTQDTTPGVAASAVVGATAVATVGTTANSTPNASATALPSRTPAPTATSGATSAPVTPLIVPSGTIPPASTGTAGPAASATTVGSVATPTGSPVPPSATATATSTPASSATPLPSATPMAGSPTVTAVPTPVVRGTPNTLRVGVQPGLARLGLPVARDRGWLGEEGLIIEERFLSDREIVASLAHGALEIGLINPVAHLQARAEGVSLQIVAAGGGESAGAATRAILVPAGSAIQSARDLEGQVVAVATLNGPDHLLVQAWLQAAGANLANVRFVELPVQQHSFALLNDRVDAIVPTEPYLSAAEATHGARLRRLAGLAPDSGGPTVLSYYVAESGWLARNGDRARRFARAIHRAHTQLDANPTEKRAAAAQQFGLSAELANRVTLPALGTRVDAASLQWWLDAERRHGRPITANPTRVRPLPTPATASELLFDSVR